MTIPAFRELPVEENTKNQSKWKDKKIRVLKYVDDAVQIEKVNMDTARLPDGSRVKHAVQSETLFLAINSKATWKGMAVNSQKTQMICVSDSLTYEAKAYIGDGAGGTIEITTGSIKILGFHLSSKPGVAAHMEEMRKRFRRRLWTILRLRELGFTETALVRVYTVYIRPMADYCASIYHSSIHRTQIHLRHRHQCWQNAGESRPSDPSPTPHRAGGQVRRKSFK